MAAINDNKVTSELVIIFFLGYFILFKQYYTHFCFKQYKELINGKESQYYRISLQGRRIYQALCRLIAATDLSENIEIILIEDGSPDRSGEIIDNYADPRIKVVHNPNLGVSHTRNVGLALASGDYVTFCDSGDYYSLDHVEKVLHAAIDQDADIVISGYYLEGEGSFTSSVKMRSHVINQDEVVKHYCIDNEFGGFCWNKLYKKKVIAGNHFPEDLDIL